MSRFNNIGFGGCVTISSLWLLANIIAVIWHYYYVEASIHPDKYASIRSKKSGFAAFYGTCYSFSLPWTNSVHARTCSQQAVFLYFYGFALMLINGCVFAGIVLECYSAGRRMKTQFFRIIVLWLVLLVLSAVGVAITLAPFIVPFFDVDLAWKASYRHVCDGFDTRVYLDSDAYKPARSVRFVDNVSGRTLYSMSMTPAPEENSDDDVYNSFTIDPGYNTPGSINNNLHPQRVDFNSSGGGHVWTAYESGGGMRNGTFSLGRDFAVPELGLTADLAVWEQNCVFDPTARIWDVNGELVVRTVQFSNCGLLQVCFRSEKLDGLGSVPVGVLMLERAKRSICCNDDNDDNDG